MARIDLDTITHELAEMEQKIDRILADAERLRPRWIPVEERLPEDGDIVWAHRPRRRHAECVTAYLVDGAWYTAEGAWTLMGVTHWMPLPEPPEVER